MSEEQGAVDFSLDDELLELLRLKNGKLFHREGRTLEFKEQFNLAGLADYFRDFAAFSNNRGGFIVFGVKDNPRCLSGLSKKSIEAFEKIDPEKISGYLGKIFSFEIRWDSVLVAANEHHFAAFKVYEAATKPVIALVDEGRDQAIRNGDVYYRYGGRTQRILSAELQAIIAQRIDEINSAWISQVTSIGAAGPLQSMVINTEQSLLKEGRSSLVIDESLVSKLKFIQEGRFAETNGDLTLKLIGDVVPMNAVEIEKTVEENIFENYPYSAMEVWKYVKSQVPEVKQPDVWSLIREEGLKGDARYSKFNFRNLAEKKRFEETGRVPSTTPVIFNEAAIAFIVNILRSR